MAGNTHNTYHNIISLYMSYINIYNIKSTKISFNSVMTILDDPRAHSSFDNL
ncbi:hypothetical protein F383_14314 [Gossypium arboreum]|uniref:Uncharacterized protein n=1 Tax=Gossypium arboreum TaxID=29729 RepID=A0A0B0NEF0_GOSAR|nr:hypothetical protein F383_14314 [Gossypium arboreum]